MLTINSLVEKLKQDYKSFMENYPKGGFYYDHYNPEHGPSSSGNDQDVYDDGFSSGLAQGKLDLIVELLGELGENSEVDYERLQEEVE